MKTRNISLKIAAMAIALGAAAAVCGVYGMTASAQERSFETITYGSVGITQDQSVQLNVVYWPPGPTVPVELTLLDSEGNILRNSDGNPVRRVVQLMSGKSASLRFDPPPIGDRAVRTQLRALVRFIPPPQPDRPSRNVIVSTLEVIDNTTDRTSFVLVPPPNHDFEQQPPPVGE